MNSLKNTVVIVLLLGVSYGVFQLMNSSDTNVSKEEEPAELELDDGLGDSNLENSSGDDGLAKLPPPVNQQSSDPNQFNSEFGAPPLLQDPPANQGGLPANNLENFPDGLSSQPPANIPNFDKQHAGNTFEGPLDSIQPNTGTPDNAKPYMNSDQMVDVNRPKQFGNPAPNTNVFNNDSQNGFQNTPPNSNRQTEIPDFSPNSNGLVNAYRQATQLTNRGDMAGALKLLSGYYHSARNEGERTELLMWLDSLAGKVIYSTDHKLTGAAYTVQENDSLQSIADSWNVPARLVYKINEQTLTHNRFESGLQLKRVQGPFRAEVNMSRKEMTMFLGDMYAGRFPLDFGQDLSLQEGTFQVQQKSDQGRIYRDQFGTALSPTDRNNPYGQFWMDLGNGLCIHGKSTADQRGCIRVDAQHVADVYGILSQNSQIKIVR